MTMLDAVRKAVIESSPYQGYLYAYPHKTAYRPFDKPLALGDLWRDEPKDALSLYIHVPFCEMRCGFCNLFTATGATHEQTAAYLDALERQATAVTKSLGAHRFAQAAIGGGTPTFLEARGLARLLDIVGRTAQRPLPIAIETSPSCTTPDRLAVLKEHGVERVSIGVESFDDTDLKAMGRPARASDAMTAMATLREADFPRLNVDMIYGAAGQTEQSFLRSLRLALRWRPDEIYLYPLYVRPLTGLGKRNTEANDQWDVERLALYRAARDHLASEGYRQRSMRHFERAGVASISDYACQEDGMVGLGPGARSYTTRTHYSTRYAVGRAETLRIIDAYVASADFSSADYGVELVDDDRRRRFIVKSLLQTEGLDLNRFAELQGARADDLYPELAALIALGLAAQEGATIKLTDTGLERSDAIGPLFVSPAMRRWMERYEWR
jgi:oxygen-independent coproporphyrinogen-3 oxidase